MAYDDFGDWIEDEPEKVKPALWVPKKVQPVAKSQASIIPKSQASISGKHHQLTQAERLQGASQGGLARRQKLSSERRTEIARIAAKALWEKRRWNT